MSLVLAKLHLHLKLLLDLGLPSVLARDRLCELNRRKSNELSRRQAEAITATCKLTRSHDRQRKEKRMRLPYIYRTPSE